MKDRYSSLKRELPAISKVVKAFPEELHGKVFDLLVAEYLGTEIPLPEPGARIPEKKQQFTKNEMAGIARIDDKGNFHLTVRDPKASAQADAVKRLTYVAIRAYLALKKDESGASRRHVVNPILSNWRVNDGNSRRWFANDKGLLRDGDSLNLDKHATDEADQFIKEILDTNIIGSWKPGASTRRKHSAKGKKE